MKKFMIGLALAAAAATPALANSYHSRMSNERWATSANENSGYGAYASAPGLDHAGQASSPPVYAYGKYQGSDPDPFIREQLRRDPPNLEH